MLTTYYLHDLVGLLKNHPGRRYSSVLTAEETRRVLMYDFSGFPQQRLSTACHIIEMHSFSAKIVPETFEAKIMQGADRLEVLGAIGSVRIFVVLGALGVTLFDAEDPFARKRNLGDKQYAPDYFQAKLLTLPLTVQTEQGWRLA